MKSAVVTIKGVSPYSQSKHYETEKLNKELPAAYEERTWRNRMHVTPDGFVEIPGPAIANAVKNAAQFLSISVPGKGKATFTKNFAAGVMVPNGIILPIKADSVPADRLFVPSDGKRGGGKRVIKFFPRIDDWGGTCTVFIFDDLITEDVFRKVLVAAGQIIGLGRFRPHNWGFYGRFIVESILWQDEDATMSAMEKVA
jgi:hypothetical protein